jgi:hypothetical protein
MNRAVIGCLLFACGEVRGRLGPENLCVQVLYEIDGTTVFREPLDVIAALLLGEPGTEVTRASSAIRLLSPFDAVCWGDRCALPSCEAQEFSYRYL